MEHVVVSLKELKNLAPPVLIYCRTLDVCPDLYAHFHCELGDESPVRVGGIPVILVSQDYWKIIVSHPYVCNVTGLVAHAV